MSNIMPAVEVIDGKPVVSSLKVAEHFGKNHRNVMRAIRKILEQAPDFGLLNFEETSYLDEFGREQPMYQMTKDGFVMLAMGFSGEKAFRFKIGYMEAFNAMEAALVKKLQRQVALTEKKTAALEEGDKKRKDMLKRLEVSIIDLSKKKHDSGNGPASVRANAVINGLLSYWAYIDNIDIEVARSILSTMFGIKKLDDVNERFSECFSFITKLIHKPLLKKGDEDQATEKQYAVILALVEACNSFRWEKESDYMKTFLEEYENSRDDFYNLSEKGAERFIHLAFALFQGVKSWTAGVINIDDYLNKIYNGLV